MDRDRKTLTDAMQEIAEKFKDTDFRYMYRYGIDRDSLFLEVLLDIRDELRSIKKTQGDSKWGTKL